MSSAVTGALRQRAPQRRSSTRRRAAASSHWATAPAALLRQLAERGAFRSFTALPASGSRAAFTVGWHRDRSFEIVVDRALKSIRVTEVLPNVAPRSAMDRAYRQFLEEFQNGELPAHRSIDRRKASVRCVNRSGSLSIALKVRDGDYAYATRKLLAVIDETYLLFLLLSDHSAYMVENLGANPDWGR